MDERRPEPEGSSDAFGYAGLSKGGLQSRFFEALRRRLNERRHGCVLTDAERRKRRHNYSWQCCYCGNPSIKFRKPACPSCGYSRCGDCPIVKSHSKESCLHCSLKLIRLNAQRPTPRTFEHLRNARISKTESLGQSKLFAPRPPKCRKGLPLQFLAKVGLREVVTGYDTGTHENHMSLDLAQELGYEVDKADASRGRFQLPNGKIIESVGRVIAEVQFAAENDRKAGSVKCYFNIFSTLAVPVLIGMTFLQVTETLTKFRCRLRDLPVGTKHSFRLCAIGGETNRVSCMIDGKFVDAHADTGAELGLVSASYAAEHGLLQEYSCEELLLADGSIEHTSGFADASVTVVDPFTSLKTTRTVRLHVLKTLNVDVILDEDTVNDFKIFQSGVGQVLSAASNVAALLAPIIHLRTVEKKIIHGKEKIKGWIVSMLPSQEGTISSTADQPVCSTQDQTVVVAPNLSATSNTNQQNTSTAVHPICTNDISNSTISVDTTSQPVPTANQSASASASHGVSNTSNLSNNLNSSVASAAPVQLVQEIDTQPAITRIQEAINELDQAENRRINRLKRAKVITDPLVVNQDVALALYEAERQELLSILDNYFSA